VINWSLQILSIRDVMSARPRKVAAPQADAKSRLEHVLSVGFSQIKVSNDSKQVVKVEKTGTPLQAALTTDVAAKMLSSLPQTKDIEGKRGREPQGMNWVSARTPVGKEVEYKDFYLAQLFNHMDLFFPAGPKTIKIRDMYDRLADMGAEGGPAGNTENPDLMLVYTDAIYFFDHQIQQASGSGATDKKFETDWPMKVRKIEMSVVNYLEELSVAKSADNPVRAEIVAYYEYLNKFIFNYFVTVKGVDIYADYSKSITPALTMKIKTMQGFVDDEMMAAAKTLTPPKAWSY
jgi:hypothetical protein